MFLFVDGHEGNILPCDLYRDTNVHPSDTDLNRKWFPIVTSQVSSVVERKVKKGEDDKEEDRIFFFSQTHT